MPGSRERFLSVLKDTPPLEYLAFISPSRPTTAMRESIQRMQRNGLTDEAINVVNDYVMRKNGFRYSAPYAEKIADTLLKKGAFTTEEALDHFASIQKKQKKGEARKQRDEEKVTPEDVAEFLADCIFTESIPLGLTDEEEKELRDFDEKISSGSVTNEQIKAYLKDFDTRSRETKKKRLEAMKKEFIADYVQGAV